MKDELLTNFLLKNIVMIQKPMETRNCPYCEHPEKLDYSPTKCSNCGNLMIPNVEEVGEEICVSWLEIEKESQKQSGEYSADDWDEEWDEEWEDR